MHELSVAMEICRMAEERLGDNAGRMTSVCVEVGDMAGIEPSSLEFCLEALLGQPPFTGARVEIARVPGDVLRLNYMEIEE